MGRKCLSISIMISMVIITIACLPFPVFASAPTEVSINGAIIALPSSNGAGWSYASGVLTLNGFNGEKIQAAGGDLTVIVNGINKIASTNSFSISVFNGDLIIKGDGRLNIVNSSPENNISIVSYEKSLIIEGSVSISLDADATTGVVSGLKSRENMTVSTSGSIVIDVESRMVGGQAMGILCDGAFTHFGTGGLNVVSKSPDNSIGFWTEGGAKFAGSGSVSITSNATASSGTVLSDGIYAANKDLYFTGSGEIGITSLGRSGNAIDCYNVGFINFLSNGEVKMNAPHVAISYYENASTINLGANNIITDPAGGKLKEDASNFTNADGSIAKAVTISFRETVSQSAGGDSRSANSDSKSEAVVSSNISSLSVSTNDKTGGDSKGFGILEGLGHLDYTWWIIISLVFIICIMIAVFIITKRKTR